MPVNLPTHHIETDGGTQPRERLDADTVDRYTEALAAGNTFPPVTVFNDGQCFWLADGFHRLAAHRAAGLADILADVREGDQRAAILHAAGCNTTHGLPRSNADKRRAVETLLRDSEWQGWSDRRIARACAVSPTTVGTIRRLSVQFGQMHRTVEVERGGRSYQMKTGGIGKHGPDETLRDTPSDTLRSFCDQAAPPEREVCDFATLRRESGAESIVSGDFSYGEGNVRVGAAELRALWGRTHRTARLAFIDWLRQQEPEYLEEPSEVDASAGTS